MTNHSRILFAVILAVISLLGITSCTREEKLEPVNEERYVLPTSHPDNDSDLKNIFFQEPFRNMNGDMVQLRDLAGTPFVIVVFPSFLTEDGRASLLGIEAIQRSYGDRLKAVFIPVEDKETVAPVMKQNPGGMIFLFRDMGKGNLSLIDKYSDLFWNPDIIAADFPGDEPAAHHTSPFYWVVDADGNIREKLIDYSDTRGVGLHELVEVLKAMLGPSDTDVTDVPNENPPE